jgi:hypothetical protein
MSKAIPWSNKIMRIRFNLKICSIDVTIISIQKLRINFCWYSSRDGFNVSINSISLLLTKIAMNCIGISNWS